MKSYQLEARQYRVTTSGFDGSMEYTAFEFENGLTYMPLSDLEDKGLWFETIRSVKPTPHTIDIDPVYTGKTISFGSHTFIQMLESSLEEGFEVPEKYRELV